jgi:hypothetical protein
MCGFSAQCDPDSDLLGSTEYEITP